MPFVNCCSPHWQVTWRPSVPRFLSPLLSSAVGPHLSPQRSAPHSATADLGRVRRGLAQSFQAPVKHLRARPRMVWNVVGLRQTQSTERWPGRPLPSTNEKSDVGPTPHLGKCSSNRRGLWCIQYMLGVKPSVFLPQTKKKKTVLAHRHRSLPTWLT